MSKQSNASEPEVRMHDRPGHLIRRAHQVHSGLWSKRVSRTVTPSQYSVLTAIHENPDCDQMAVAREASLDSSTAGAVILRLIERGWIAATRDTRDRRRNVLRLTDEGNALFNKLAGPAAAMSEELVRRLDEKQRACLTDLLTRLVEDGERAAGEV